MQTREWTFCDKTSWGEGPWLHEPDKLQWPDPATGLPCLIVRNDRVTGALCGYVGVPPGHPLHGTSDFMAPEVSVHGGLTFAAKCNPLEGDQGICHVADPGEPDDVWWLGFDCSHSGDLSPRTESLLTEIYARKSILSLQKCTEAFEIRRETYRDLRYVKEQVASLATQLAALA